MTELLQKAFEAASKLPKEEQDTLAAVLMDELESEARWSEAFSNSRDKLAQLGEEARAEYLQGKTKPLED